MRLRYYVAMLAIAIGTSLALAPGAQAAVTANIEVPIVLPLTIPCNGDTVNLTGNVHVVTALTINGNHFTEILQSNPQGVSGTDETTGAKYQGTGTTKDTFSGSFTNGQYQETFVNREDFLGQGSAPNFLIHETAHVTLNAAGNVTVFFDNPSVSCK